MFRSLFSIAAICSLLFVSLGVPAASAARKRCPEEPPSTILSLFKASDAVYIGKFDKTTEGDVVRTDEDSSTVSVSQHFSISTTIKGESKKFFVRTYDDYRYRQVMPEAAEQSDAPVQDLPGGEMEEPEEEMESEGEDYRPLRPGDPVLLFLKYAEDEEDAPTAKKRKKQLDLAHYRDGIKRLDEKEVSSYEARIRELKGILSKKNKSDADVLNWILRCIDDPITRWEGAYELQSSFENLDWQERSKKQHEDAEAASANGAESEDESENTEEGFEVEDDVFDNSVYAKLLTDAQKARLMQIALSSKPAGSEEMVRVRDGQDGDRILFEVVKRWGDSKLASAMLDRLRSAGDNNFDKYTWMTSIAEVLKDSELSAISDKFGNVTYQSDEEEMFGAENDEAEETVVDGPVIPEPERTGEPDPEKTEPANDAVDKSDKKTYKQYRDELLANFFAKATAIITQEKENAKAK